MRTVKYTLVTSLHGMTLLSSICRTELIRADADNCERMDARNFANDDQT